MGRKLFVGNLGHYVAREDLQQLFASHGTVQSAQVVADRWSGQSRGFGFVEMGSDEEAGHAIAALHGQELDGRALAVNQATPRVPRSSFHGQATSGRCSLTARPLATVMHHGQPV